MTGGIRVGFITGLIEEAQACRSGDGQVDLGAAFYLRHGERYSIACAGIGKVNAAHAASLLVHQGCDLLVSLGVAGRLTPGPTGAHWVKDALQHDYGAQRGGRLERYRAGSMPFGPSDLVAYTPVANPGLELPEARILTGDAFIEDAVAAAELGAALDGELIDMETAAIAQVATCRGLGWAGIRAVSDTADGESESDFKANLTRAANEAAKAASQFLDLL